MPEEDQTSGEILPQNGYPLRWIVFVFMWIFGMTTIVMDVATQEASWDWKVISYASVNQAVSDIRLIENRVYLVWIVATAIFVFQDMKPTKTFVM